MTHHLRQRAHENPITAPLVASLRYQCDCAKGEVVFASVVLDMNVTESQFMWTMQQLWRDVKLEVEQHLKGRGDGQR